MKYSHLSNKKPTTQLDLEDQVQFFQRHNDAHLKLTDESRLSSHQDEAEP